MSSGIGIARFAARKVQTGYPEGKVSGTESNCNSTPAKSLETNANFRIVETTINNFDDAASTASDDEFSFLGSGSSAAGENMFTMNACGFNREIDEDEIHVNETKDNVEKTTEYNSTITARPHAGIDLFRSRNSLSNSNTTQSSNHGWKNKNDKDASPVSKLSENSETNGSIIELFDTQEAIIPRSGQVGDITDMTCVTQTTPDGRILPMPMITPHCDNTVLTKVGGATPSQQRNNSVEMMAPPPNRHSIVTPTDSVRNHFNVQAKGSEVAAQLFPSQGKTFTGGDKPPEALATTRVVQTPQFLNNSNSVPVDFLLENDAELTDVTNGEGSNGTDICGVSDFHNCHQQFNTKIRDLHDLDQKYNDVMFEGKIQVDVATSTLLQLKCQMYQVTDQILQQLDHVNNTLCEFIPTVIDDE